MATITLRSVKGTPLTVAEVDANFNNLNTGKLETSNNLSDLTNTTTARTNLGVAIGTNVQAYDGDLAAIAAIAGTSGLLRKTAANVWSLDTTAYGTVASVALSLPDIFTVSGSPITTSGTLTAALASQLAKYVLAAPNGVAGAPSFRLLVPSDVSGLAASATTDTTNAANITTGTLGTARLATTGTASATTYLRGDQAWVTLAASATSDTTNATNITSGTLVVARGGTGTSTTPSQGGVIYAASTSGYASTLAGTAGQVLTSNGISAPTWTSLSLAASATTDTTNAANITSGTLGTARLASGIASATTYLRGDQTWVSLAASATSDTTDATNITSGTLVVARGGTGTSTTPSQGGVIYAASAAGYASTVAGTAGQVLTSNGISAPTWTSLSLAASATTDTTNAGNISSGTLAVARGGTGTSTAPVQGGMIYGASITGYASTVVGTSGQVLRSNGTAAPSWITLAASATTDTTNATNITSGTLAVARGGTNGSAAPTAGAIAYGTGTAFAFTAAGTAGQVISSNAGLAPSWVTLAASATTDTTNATNITSGTLVIARGGTNSTATPTAGAIAYGSGTAYLFSTAGTAGDLLTSGGTGAPTWTGSTSANTANALVRRDVNGDFSARIITATDFNSTSDQTLKENVVTISDATSIVQQLNGVEFNWKVDGEKSAGVIAQQLEMILPHLVKVEPTTGIKGVNYSGLIGYLIESIKTLDRRLSDLEHK